MSEVKVNKISPRSGTAITLGDSGDTFTIPSGATLAIAGTVTGFTSAGIDDNATSVAITINSSEQVGIGTTSPASLLDVQGTGVVAAFKSTNNNTVLRLKGSNATNGGALGSTSSGDLTFLQNLAEGMRLDTSGRLLVGKTNTARTTVGSEIRGDGFIRGTKSGGHPFDAVRTSDQGDVIRIYSDNTLKGVLGTEKWGIGTASPSHTLDVVGDAQIKTADNSDTLSLVSTDADANSGPNLRLYRNSGSPADDDVVGRIDFEGRNNNSQDVIYANMQSEIMAVADGSEDGQLQFGVMKAGTLRNALMLDRVETVFNEDSVDIDFRVESDGNANMLFVDAGNNRVGIGTNAPAHNLEIVTTASGSVNDSLQIRNNSASSGTGSRIRFINSTDSASDANGASISCVRIGSDNDLVFETENSEAMRIDHTGKVGIGTTSPGQTLTVAGDLTVQKSGDNLKADFSNGVNANFRISTAGTVAQIGPSTTSDVAFVQSSNEYMRITSAGKVGINTSSPYGKFEVHSGGGGSNYSGSSAIKSGVTWGSESNSHTISLFNYNEDDNSSGMLLVHAKADNNKCGTLMLLFTKKGGSGVGITTVSTKTDGMSTFSAATSGNNINISTDSDCAICWQSYYGV